MSRLRNPFTATLGANPPLLVGRKDVIEDFEDALDGGVGAHERLSFLVGPRGIGKTVLLNQMEDAARERGWVVISETATQERSSHEPQSTAKGSIRAGVPGFQVGVDFGGDSTAQTSLSLRNAFNDLYGVLGHLAPFNEEEVGVLVTLDELHYTHADEITDFAVTIQHLVREERQIAVVFAGIPSSVRPLLASDQGRNPITFLRRANRFEVGKVPDADVEQGLSLPLEELGWRWDPAALDKAVEASGGYPFMMQLIGHWAFRTSSGPVIQVEETKEAIRKARKKLGQLVHAPALDDLSNEDKRFLAAMSFDDAASKVADVAQRLQVSEQQAYNYRRRLAEADMVDGGERGAVSFTLPYLREYLQEHVVVDLFPEGNLKTQTPTSRR